MSVTEQQPVTLRDPDSAQICAVELAEHIGVEKVARMMGVSEAKLGDWKKWMGRDEDWEATLQSWNPVNREKNSVDSLADEVERLRPRLRQKEIENNQLRDEVARCREAAWVREHIGPEEWGRLIPFQRSRDELVAVVVPYLTGLGENAPLRLQHALGNYEHFRTWAAEAFRPDPTAHSYRCADDNLHALEFFGERDAEWKPFWIEYDKSDS